MDVDAPPLGRARVSDGLPPSPQSSGPILSLAIVIARGTEADQSPGWPTTMVRIQSGTPARGPSLSTAM